MYVYFFFNFLLIFKAQDLLQKLSDLTMFRRRNVRDIKLSVPSSELTKTISEYV